MLSMKRSTAVWIFMIFAIVAPIVGLVVFLAGDGTWYVILISLILCAVFLVISVRMSMVDPNIVFLEDGIEVSGPMLDIVIPYDAITNVEMRSKFDYGMKLGGYEGASRLGGTFSNKEFGTYKIAAFSTNREFMIVHHANGVLAFNTRAKEETQSVYTRLTDAAGHGMSSASYTQDGMENVMAGRKGGRMAVLLMSVAVVVPAAVLLYMTFISDMFAAESMIYVMLAGFAMPFLCMGVFIVWEKRKKINTGKTVTVVVVGIVLSMALGLVPMLTLAVPNASGVDVAVDTELRVRAPFVDETVRFDDIVSVETRDGMDYGKRTAGYGGSDIRSGKFTNNEFGTYRLAVFKSSPLAIVVHHVGGVLVFNQDTAEETERIHALLTSKL